MSDSPVVQFQKVRTVDVAYRRAGFGAPLVYLHGAGLTKMWQPVCASLAHSFDVIAPEHPGFGETRRPRWYRTIDDIALHYADFLDALGIREPVHFVGHSYGSLVSVSFASIFPERVRSLSLIAPGPLPVVSPPMDAPIDLPENFDFDALLFNDFQDEYPAYRRADDEGTFLAAVEEELLLEPITGFLPAVENLSCRLARVTAPAQVLVPDEDRLFPIEVAQTWSSYLAQAPIIKIQGQARETGHLLVVQEPAAIAQVVVDFTAK